jgi:hypothetical protein
MYCGPTSGYAAKMAAFAGINILDKILVTGVISSGLVLVGSKRENVIHCRTFGSRVAL